MRKGERVRWRGLNRVLGGVIQEDAPMRDNRGRELGYPVRLDNGKMVIVHKDSMTRE